MVAELVIEDLVKKEVLLLKVLSRTRSYCRIVVLQWATETKILLVSKIFSNLSSANSLGGACRAETTDHWTAPSGTTVKIPPLFDGPTSWFKCEKLVYDWLDHTQLKTGKRGPALKSRLVGDASMYKGVFLWRCFPLFAQSEKNGDGQVDWNKIHNSSSVWKTPGWTCYQRTTWVKPEDKIIVMLVCPEKMRKVEAEVKNLWIRMNRKHEKGVLHRWQPAKGYFHSVITWQHWCSLVQVISAKPRETDVRVFYPRSWCFCLHISEYKGSMWGIVLYAEKQEAFSPNKQIQRPSLEISKFVQNIHSCRWFRRRIWTVCDRWINWGARPRWRWKFVLLDTGRQSVYMENQAIQEPSMKEEKSKRQGRCLSTDNIFSFCNLLWRWTRSSQGTKWSVFQLLWRFFNVRGTIQGFQLAWRQFPWILPTIRRKLFLILVVHDHLDQERQSEGSRQMRCIVVWRQDSVPAVRLSVFANSEGETCRENCLIHFPTTPPCSTRVDVLETGDVPILFSLLQMQKSGYYTWTGSSRERSVCPTKHVTSVLSQRKSAYPAWRWHTSCSSRSHNRFWRGRWRW